MSTSKKIVLKSSVRESFEVGEAVALESQTNRHMTEDDCSDHDIPIPNTNSKILAKLRKMLDLLVHASQCRSALCQYPYCPNVKDLFRHGIHYAKHVHLVVVFSARKCGISFYYMLALARNLNAIKNKDLKEHSRRLQQQSDGQRAAELNNSG